jgi:protein-S-isoprenylcysteine O-methyltransferase Ste14
MESRLIEGLMVLVLFLGYRVLWKIKKRELLRVNGDDPEVIYNDSRPTQRYFGSLSRLLSVSIVLLIVIHSKGVTDIAGFYQMDLLDYDIFDFIGFVLGFGGLALCWQAQRQMGNSWRVGLDRKNKTELLTTGVFQTIRNPTYSGLFIICAGTLMIFPTMSFLVWVMVFCIAIEFQVRIEEEFLTDTHGEQYTRYYQTTKRYIPFFY